MGTFGFTYDQYLVVFVIAFIECCGWTDGCLWKSLLQEVDFAIKTSSNKEEHRECKKIRPFSGGSPALKSAQATSHQMAGASRGADFNRSRQPWHLLAFPVCSAVGCSQHFKVACFRADTLTSTKADRCACLLSHVDATCQLSLYSEL